VKTSLKSVLLAAGSICVAGTAGPAHPAPVAKLSLDEARAIALTAASGTVVDEEYEEENGAWRYSFEFTQDGRIHEIGVDATSGTIVEDSWEDAADHD
jgi:uncharacterized membrane protein YkoI